MKGPKDSTPAAAFEIHPKQIFFVFFGSPRGVIMVPKLMKPQIDTSKLGPPIRGGTWVGGFGPLDPPPPVGVGCDMGKPKQAGDRCPENCPEKEFCPISGGFGCVWTTWGVRVVGGRVLKKWVGRFQPG